jgi:hypothetical protein
MTQVSVHVAGLELELLEDALEHDNAVILLKAAGRSVLPAGVFVQVPKRECCTDAVGFPLRSCLFVGLRALTCPGEARVRALRSRSVALQPVVRVHIHHCAMSTFTPSTKVAKTPPS